MPGRPARRSAMRLLVPREYGAYGQLLLPLSASLLLGRPGLPAWGLATAAVGGFLAHEGLAVLFGRRGPRALREQGPAAFGSAGFFGGAGAVAGVAAFVRAPPDAQQAALVTLLLAAAAMAAARVGHERTAAGETLAAVALSSWSVPVALAGGVAPTVAATCGVAWALSFSAASLVVRAIIARTLRRAFGRQLAAGVVLGAAPVPVALWLGRIGAVPAGTGLALLPTCVLVVALAGLGLHARHLRRVGWSIVAAAVMTVLAMVTAMPRS